MYYICLFLILSLSLFTTLIDKLRCNARMVSTSDIYIYIYFSFIFCILTTSCKLGFCSDFVFGSVNTIN